jgi:hypothetical protein
LTHSSIAGGSHPLHDERELRQGEFPLSPGLDLVQIEAEKGLLDISEIEEIHLATQIGRTGDLQGLSLFRQQFPLQQLQIARGLPIHKRPLSDFNRQ